MKKRLEDVVKELHQISGFRICIYDLKAQEVFAWPRDMSAFCRLIQQNEECLRYCRENDEKAFEYVRNKGESLIYQCHAGLYEGISPLYDNGRLSGFLMMGQALEDMGQSRQEACLRTRRYVADSENLKQAIQHIPQGRKAQIASCMAIMDICAAYITLSNQFKMTEADLSHKVKSYLNRNYQDKISLDKLCRLFGCSRGALTSSFRRSYQMSIHQYLMEYRLERSLELLQDKSVPIGEIAWRTGFTDQNYFSKVFKKRFGMAPSGYQKLEDERFFH